MRFSGSILRREFALLCAESAAAYASDVSIVTKEEFGGWAAVHFVMTVIRARVFVRCRLPVSCVNSHVYAFLLLRLP